MENYVPKDGSNNGQDISTSLQTCPGVAAQKQEPLAHLSSKKLIISQRDCRIWHQGKRVLLVSEYYRKFSDMCNAVSQHYRTVRFNLELLRDANRKAEPFCRNL